MKKILIAVCLMTLFFTSTAYAVTVQEELLHRGLTYSVQVTLDDATEIELTVSAVELGLDEEIQEMEYQLHYQAKRENGRKFSQTFSFGGNCTAKQQLRLKMGGGIVLVSGPQQEAHTFNTWRYLSEEQHIRWCQNGFCLKKEKAAHDYTTATCTAKASCKDCGTEIGEVDKNNHTDKVILPAVEPTETKPGWTEGLKCNACGEIIIPQKPVYLPPKTGDGANLMLWSALALVSLLGAMSVIRKRSKA